MLFTAISYGKMAPLSQRRLAFTMSGAKNSHPALGYVTGWSMAMDYLLNPLICTILCCKFAMNFFPEIPYAVWVVAFVGLFHLIEYARYSDCRPASTRVLLRSWAWSFFCFWRQPLVTCTRHLMTESGSLPARFSTRKLFPSEPSWAGPRWPC